ncbi:MAG: fumarylacetoacetate hydrolase family protein [Fimbriimonadaceae bacterium]|nr:fumarylacetoacetate hydrolase family protein [Fimbriimonadaceae bacterium]
MKLCRFELISEPGSVHSGFLHDNKVYETDGAQPTAVHDWTDLVPLTPVGRPPSVRLFELGDDEVGFSGMDVPFTPFRYLNPSSLIAPSRELTKPTTTDALGILPCLAAVVASTGLAVEPEEAEEMILGYTLANCFVAQDRLPHASAYDVAVACGPFLTTPDELAESSSPGAQGPILELRGTVRVNSEIVGEIDLSHLPASLATLCSQASQSSPLAEGDLVLLGPLWAPESPLSLEPFDEVHLFVDRLGTLATRIV